jgi:hypothetical protein
MTNSGPEQMNIGDATTGRASGLVRIFGRVDTVRVSGSVGGVGRVSQLVRRRVDSLLGKYQQTCDRHDRAADQQNLVPTALVREQGGDPQGCERHVMDRTAPAD